MGKFKVGDQVRVNTRRWDGAGFQQYGLYGKIESYAPSRSLNYRVQYNKGTKDHGGNSYSEDDLEFADQFDHTHFSAYQARDTNSDPTYFIFLPKLKLPQQDVFIKSPKTLEKRRFIFNPDAHFVGGNGYPYLFRVLIESLGYNKDALVNIWRCNEDSGLFIVGSAS